MLKIVQAPSLALSRSAKPVTIRYLTKQISKVNANILKLIEEMKQTLLSAKDPVGVGLAAPQVEKPLQIFIAKPTPKSNIQVFINPKVIGNEIARGGTTRRAPDSAYETNFGALAGGKVGTGPRASETGPAEKETTKLEGCLSLPNIWGYVERDPIITISYLDGNNKSHTQKFNGFMATVIQHEMDHLQGILFPKRVLEQKGTLYKSHKDEKGEDIFEEIEI